MHSRTSDPSTVCFHKGNLTSDLQISGALPLGPHSRIVNWIVIPGSVPIAQSLTARGRSVCELSGVEEMGNRPEVGTPG